MSGYVIDANVLVGMLISGKASHRQLLRFFDFASPDFVFEEIDKYQADIRAKTKLDVQQLAGFIYSIFSQLTVLPSLFLSEEAKYQAAELTFDIGPKDVSYVALALQLDAILLTNDKKLVAGLKLKGFRKVMLWEDFLKSL
jgi:predicted nucleic acid-binding protein